MKTIITLVIILSPLWALGHSNGLSVSGMFDNMCHERYRTWDNIPDNATYHKNPEDYADDFCVLLMYDHFKVLSQFSKMLTTNRLFSNPNRYYYHLYRHPGSPYVQVRRSYMKQNHVVTALRQLVRDSVPERACWWY